MTHWLYLGYLGIIPIAWWTTNKVRACASRWRANRNYRNIKRANEIQPEPQDYCFGCDEIRPRSWMAFVDEDGDGETDAVYRCKICRNMPKQIGVDAAGMPEIDHEDGCQCTNCNPWQPLTEAQIENARRHSPARIDIGELDYTDAVEYYRGYGIDATNETDRAYKVRMAKREQRRLARYREDLRAKYGMDSNAWRGRL